MTKHPITAHRGKRMEEAIVQAALDYVEGWYEADGARMDHALHPKLAKRRITPEGEVWEVNKEWMVEATGDGRGRIEDPRNGRKEVTILDTTETMACVKIISEKFVDYVHLVWDGGAWRIVNVLWDYVHGEPE
jgi:hypothetical protein